MNVLVLWALFSSIVFAQDSECTHLSGLYIPRWNGDPVDLVPITSLEGEWSRVLEISQDGCETLALRYLNRKTGELLSEENFPSLEALKTHEREIYIELSKNQLSFSEWHSHPESQKHITYHRVRQKREERLRSKWRR